MAWLAVIGIAVAPIVASMVLLGRAPLSWVDKISRFTIRLQIAVAVVAFLLLRAMPDDGDSFGGSCPNWHSPLGRLIETLVSSSVVIGGVAVGSSILARRRQIAAGGRVIGAFFAEALVAALWIVWVLVHLCGLN